MKLAASLVCVCALCCVVHKGLAQSSPRFSVLASPALFMPVTVAAQVGVQAKVGRRYGLLVELAIPTFQPNNTEFESIRSFRTGFEAKYFLKQKGGAVHYASVQSSYLFRQLTNPNQGSYYTRTQTVVYGNARIQSPVLAVALKRGLELAAGKRIYVDAFVGAGLRMILTRYDAKTALPTSSEPPQSDFFDYDAAWRYNYTLLRFHGTAGLRLGWRL